MTTTLDHRPTLDVTRLTRPGVVSTRARGPVAAPNRAGAGAVAPWERNGDRRDRSAGALRELFSARDDLGGVSTVADVLAEDVLWSV